MSSSTSLVMHGRSLQAQLQSVAAPGAMFNRSGNVSNAYLNVGTVVSSTTGFPVRLSNAELIFIAVTNSLNGQTYQVEIYEYNPILATETLKATVSVVSARGSDYTPPTPIPISYGNELRAKVNNVGSCKDPVVIAFTTGEVPI